MSDGGALVVGQAHDPDDVNGTQAWATRLDADGNIVGSQTWKSDQGRHTRFFAVDVDGRAAVLAQCTLPDVGLESRLILITPGAG